METKLKLNLILFGFEFNITRILADLRVLLKVNFFLLPTMIAAYAAGYIVWNQLSANVEQDVMETAGLMLGGRARCAPTPRHRWRRYWTRSRRKWSMAFKICGKRWTSKFQRLLQKAMTGLPMARQQRISHTALHEIHDIADQGPNDLPQRQFFPQSIPFYAATEAFNNFRVQFPEFAYKEAALNPTNPRDRTADWESDIVNFFRDNPSKAELAGRRDTPTGSSLYLSTPIRADSDRCLGCHGPAEKAPPELVKLLWERQWFWLAAQRRHRRASRQCPGGSGA
jgi:hypothetical protein